SRPPHRPSRPGRARPTASRPSRPPHRPSRPGRARPTASRPSRPPGVLHPGSGARGLRRRVRRSLEAPRPSSTYQGARPRWARACIARTAFGLWGLPGPRPRLHPLAAWTRTRHHAFVRLTTMRRRVVGALAVTGLVFAACFIVILGLLVLAERGEWSLGGN